MLYFKHSELVNEYHVSLKTVHNWIDAAKQGKVELELYDKNGRIYIANTPANETILKRLALHGKKFKNARYNKVAEPQSGFYELYTRKQILDIITNLDLHREIPRQYNYFDGGAKYWDDFVRHSWKDNTPSLAKGTVELLRANRSVIDSLLEGHERINVIDIGPGNGMPVKELLARLLQDGRLNRYIAIDISRSMLDIVEANVKEWFGDAVKVESYLRDITYERFDDLLVDDMLDNKASKTINVALFLGATPMNFINPKDSIKVIYNSLSQNDILIYTDKPDSEIERRYFDFNTEPEMGDLPPKYRLIFDMMNIDQSLYDVEMAYNERERYRYIQVRFKQAVDIKFSFEHGERLVSLSKGETVMLWRVWHMRALEIISNFEDAGFTLLQSSLTKDRHFLLTVFGLNKPY